MDIDSILKDIPDKRSDKNTTSLVMKKDIINFFKDNYLNKKCFEIGTNRGYTTRVLSFLFDKVKTVDIDTNLIDYSFQIRIFIILMLLNLMIGGMMVRKMKNMMYFL